jgi:hypothetical protein
LQGALETLKIPYTGQRRDGVALAMDIVAHEARVAGRAHPHAAPIAWSTRVTDWMLVSSPSSAAAHREARREGSTDPASRRSPSVDPRRAWRARLLGRRGSTTSGCAGRGVRHRHGADRVDPRAARCR